MLGQDSRSLLLRALLLDWFGQLLILSGIIWIQRLLHLPNSVSYQLEGQSLWLIFCLLLYPLLSWLFGSYTVLRWRRLHVPVLIQRLLITATLTLFVIGIARWLFAPGDEVWLVSMKVQAVWVSALTCWALLSRISRRRGFLMPDTPCFILFAKDDEVEVFLRPVRVSPRQHLVLLFFCSRAAIERRCGAVRWLSRQVVVATKPFGLIERLEIQIPASFRQFPLLVCLSSNRNDYPLPTGRLRFVVRLTALGSYFQCADSAQAFGRFVYSCCLASANGSFCRTGCRFYLDWPGICLFYPAA